MKEMQVVKLFLPRSKTATPKYGVRGFGIIIVVCPAYAISKGSAANEGSSNFLFTIKQEQ